MRDKQPVDFNSTNPSDRDSATGSSGNAKVLLYVGLGCFAFFAAMCVIAGIGIYLLVSFVNELETVGDAPGGTPNRGLPSSVDVAYELSDPPLMLAAPSPPPTRFGDLDLTTVDPRSLSARAHAYYSRHEYRGAVQCQYLWVINEDEGRYNLACYYARSGDIEAALYWLQAAAKDEESNAEWASRDADLDRVRMDQRWPELLAYLRGRQKFWESSDTAETALILPRNAPAGQPLPVFIGLHGLGHNAHGFVNERSFQPLADEMGVAFLGVSGTQSRGKRNFVWAEDPARDLVRIDAALEEVADRLTPAAGQIVLFGFSQGGSVAGELALRHPQRFAGAITISPGSVSELPALATSPRDEHRRQGLVAVCGEREHPRTVACTNRYAAGFKAVGARVYVKFYPGVSAHTFPFDFYERFPGWGKFILEPGAPVPGP
ncbi:MAG: alpha/beta hydrolase [Planctomycetales bacterium]